MTHTYSISGMTCNGCMNTVKSLLEKVEHVTAVTMDLQQGTASITMSRHVATPLLQAALKNFPQYQLTEQAA
jgi:copper chaperone CopZ